MLERDAPYVQIIEHYRQEIRAGRLADGDMLPSGREIAAQFGVSLATAAKVATGLQALGLVTARPGLGTVVTGRRPPADRARGGPVLISLATRSPIRPGDKARVLEAGLAPAPQSVAVQLGTAPFAEVIRRRQAVVRDGCTVAMLTSWFPAHMAETIPVSGAIAYSPQGTTTGLPRRTCVAFVVDYSEDTPSEGPGKWTAKLAVDGLVTYGTN